MAFDATGSMEAKTLDRCADRRLHFGNKKTFPLRARILYPGSNVRWWISLSTRPDIFTLKSFKTRHIASDEASLLIRFAQHSNIAEAFRYFVIFYALFFLTFTFIIYDVYMTILFFTGCSCVVYSSSDRPQGGTFTSPDFPKRYPSNIDCLLYTFIGQPDEIVVLTFHQFNIRRIGPE